MAMVDYLSNTSHGCDFWDFLREWLADRNEYRSLVVDDALFCADVKTLSAIAIVGDWTTGDRGSLYPNKPLILQSATGRDGVVDGKGEFMPLLPSNAVIRSKFLKFLKNSDSEGIGDPMMWVS